MKIQGMVVEDAKLSEQTSRYRIRNKDGTYLVTASGKEAVKDYLFIRKGQRVTVEGNETEKGIHKEQAIIELDEAERKLGD